MRLSNIIFLLFLSTNQSSAFMVQRGGQRRSLLSTSSPTRESVVYSVSLEEDQETTIASSFTTSVPPNTLLENKVQLAAFQNATEQLSIADATVLDSSDTQETTNNGLEGLIWRGAVVFLCAVWASNFPAIKLVVAEPGVDSLLFAVARFSVATLALAPFAIREIRQADPKILWGSAVCGSWVAFGR